MCITQTLSFINIPKYISTGIFLNKISLILGFKHSMQYIRQILNINFSGSRSKLYLSVFSRMFYASQFMSWGIVVLWSPWAIILTIPLNICIINHAAQIISTCIRCLIFKYFDKCDCQEWQIISHYSPLPL